MEEKITNKEIYKFMSESSVDRAVMHEFLSNIESKVDATLIQTKITNGRVSSLERWRSYTLGAMAVISAVVIPTAFLVLGKYI